MVADSFVAEFRKLGKRPASWLLGLLMVLNVALSGYLFTYLAVRSQQAVEEKGLPSSVPRGAGVETLLQSILPANTLLTVLELLSGIGGPIALIFGALVFGSEYGWGTMKLMLTQHPTRLAVFSGKSLTILCILIVFAILSLFTGAASSYVVATLENAPIDWPSVMECLKAFGVACLILFAWGGLGVFLASLLRSTALAVGLGLVYALAVENLVTQVPTQSEILQTIQGAFLSINSTNLVNSFLEGSNVENVAESALILAIYATMPLLLAALIFKGRDVA